MLSSDAGAPVYPIWTLLLPSAAVIALALALPPRTPLPVSIVERGAALRSALVLSGCAVTFMVIAALPGIAGGALFIVAKLLLLIIIPATAVSLLRPAIAFERAPGRSTAVVLVLLVVVWALLAKVAPWNPGGDFSRIDPVFLLVAALGTALSAGVGEELFYRRWLQPRLEAILGAWPGIALTALAFSLMHLGTHGSADAPLLSIATAIVGQGSFGLMLGILWWRYRQLWPLIVIHVLANGWEVVPALLG